MKTAGAGTSHTPRTAAAAAAAVTALAHPPKPLAVRRRRRRRRRRAGPSSAETHAPARGPSGSGPAAQNPPGRHITGPAARAAGTGPVGGRYPAPPPPSARPLQPAWLNIRTIERREPARAKS
jgi:hypothetical protein